MAIANLNAGGAGGNRPPVGAFFGKSAANDNMQKISSDFISKDIVSSVLDTIGGISAELKKIQQFSKDATKGFERLVVDMRKLNNEITSKFRSVNSQIKKDNMEFLRSITTRPSGEGLMSVSEANAPGAGAAGVGAAAATNAATPEKKSFVDSISNLADLADTAKDVFDIAKKYGPRVMQGARAFAGSAALPITALAGGMIALAYHRKQAQEADPVGAENFDRSISSGSKRAEVIQGTDADKNAPNANADVSRKRMAIPDFLMAQGVISKPSEARGVIADNKGDIFVLKDGRWWDNKEQVLKDPSSNPLNQGKPQLSDVPAHMMRNWQLQFPEMIEAYKKLSPEDVATFKKLIAEGNESTADRLVAMRAGIEAAPTQKKLAETGKNITSRNLGATIAGTEAAGDPKLGSVVDKTASGISAAIDETGGKPPEDGTPMKVSDIPPSAPPADVPAEGNTPAAKEAGAPTAAAAPAPAATPAMGTPAQVEEYFSNLANVSGVQVEKGKDLPPNALAALDAMISNDPEATARKYPAWVLEQYAKQNGKGSPAGGAGDQTNPELGGGAGGTPAAEGGTAGGGSMGGPEGEPGMPAGAPEAAPSGPPSVPADLTPPSQASQDATPVVINNESSSSSGSVTNPEGNASSGQNLPMTAQNDALTEYFAKQNIDYQ
jgi:hypothetical protein